MDRERKGIWNRFVRYNPNVQSASAREIDYLDTAPAKIDVQISLVEYFERIKRYRARKWQRDLCDRLQEAAANRHLKRWWGLIHVEGQAGKTTIISQCFPAWLYGHDPLFRFALAMYNVRQSQKHAAVVIQMMQSNIHKDIFPNKDGWLYADFDANNSKVARTTSKEGFFTNARRELNDGQFSHNPVGLQSGLVGSGFDWLGIDDPYRERKEAFSEQIRDNLENFYDSTVLSRTGLHSCISGMFHRYAPEDLAGYLLDTGDFEYLRYATEADGDYIHEKTGKRYPDPLNREPGELLMPEDRPPKYYEKVRKNNQVWLSMNQGRPSTEEGEFYNVGELVVEPPERASELIQQCVAVARSYDNAATAEESGAYSVGVKGGILANGRHVVFDMWRERVDSGTRYNRQREIAERDGHNVEITIPRDPGAAGKDVVWYTTQKVLPEYIVIGMETSGSKEARALNSSAAVNSGDVSIIEAPWNVDFKRELRDFPLSEYKDIVDAFADNYNHLYQKMKKGKIVTGYKPQRNLLTYTDFGKMFPYKNEAGRKVLKVPDSFTIYAGVKTSADASLPNCGIIVARASENTELDETLFILGEYKQYDADYHKLFDWLDRTLRIFCKRNDTKNTTIWLHPESVQFAPAIRQKLDVGIAEFEGDKWAGYAELNWYFIPTEKAHPTNAAEKAARMYGLIKPGMEIEARDKDGKPSPLGLYSLRQEIVTCGFTDKAEPAATCQVLDVLRMCVAGFSTTATPRTIQESFTRALGEEGVLKPGEVADPVRQQQILDARAAAKKKVREEFGYDEDEEIYDDEID